VTHETRYTKTGLVPVFVLLVANFCYKSVFKRKASINSFTISFLSFVSFSSFWNCEN